MGVGGSGDCRGGGSCGGRGRVRDPAAKKGEQRERGVTGSRCRSGS